MQHWGNLCARHVKIKSLLGPQSDSKFLFKNLILHCGLNFWAYVPQIFLTRHNRTFNLCFLVCTRLHSDENTHFASQRSSLLSFLMVFAIFSGRKNQQTHIYFPSWAIRKNEPLAFLDIVTRRPWPYMHLYCFNLVQCVDKHEVFLPPEFQIANFWASRTSWFQQSQPNAQSPNTLHLLLPSLIPPQWVCP